MQPCPQCGRPVDAATNKFCPWCGQRLSLEAPVASANGPASAHAPAVRDDYPSYLGPTNTEPLPGARQTGAASAVPPAQPYGPPPYTPPRYMQGQRVGAPVPAAPPMRRPWTPPAQPHTPRTPLVVGGVVALLVVALVCVIIAANSLSNRGGQPGGANTGNGGTTQPTATATVVWSEAVNDPLTTNTAGWVEDNNCFFKDGSYHVKNSRYCYRGSTYQDVTVSVDVQLIDGSAKNPYGLLLGISDDGTYYNLMVTGNGLWHFNHCVKYKCTTLLPDSKADALNTGQDTSNNLKVTVTGTHFVIFLNGQQVGEIDDDAYTGGKVGLIAGSKVEAAFNNLVVLAPAS